MYILNLEMTEFADKFDVLCKRKIGVKDNVKVLAFIIGRIRLSFT